MSGVKIRQRQLSKDKGAEGKGKRASPPLCIGLTEALTNFTEIFAHVQFSWEMQGFARLYH